MVLRVVAKHRIIIAEHLSPAKKCAQHTAFEIEIQRGVRVGRACVRVEVARDLP